MFDFLVGVVFGFIILNFEFNFKLQVIYGIGRGFMVGVEVSFIYFYLIWFFIFGLLI